MLSMKPLHALQSRYDQARVIRRLNLRDAHAVAEHVGQTAPETDELLVVSDGRYAVRSSRLVFIAQDGLAEDVTSPTDPVARSRGLSRFIRDLDDVIQAAGIGRAATGWAKRSVDEAQDPGTAPAPVVVTAPNWLPGTETRGDDVIDSLGYVTFEGNLVALSAPTQTITGDELDPEASAAIFDVAADVLERYELEGARDAERLKRAQRVAAV